MMPDASRRLPDGRRVIGLIDATLVRFAAVGLITTALDLVIFSGLALYTGLPAVAANVVSYSCGIATSFVLNRTWTFGIGRGRGGIERHSIRFVASNLAGLALSSLLVALFVLVLPAIAAKAVSVPLVFLWNYAVARFWVFR